MIWEGLHKTIFVVQITAFAVVLGSFCVVWALGLVGIVKSRLDSSVNAAPFSERSLQQINENLQTQIQYTRTKAGRVFMIALTTLVTAAIVLGLAITAEFVLVAQTGREAIGAAR
ncbi:MAG: hypothetical protein AAFY38_06710 [Pseudomonadota bacterium]